MGAKIMLTGTARAVQFHKKANKWVFRLTTGPAYGNAPKGLKMFGETEYHIECTNRQWTRGHAGEDDDSELIIEGYQAPRQEGGKLYIAVIAMAVSTKRVQTERKFEQIKNELDKAIDAFRQGKEEKLPPEQLRALAELVVKTEEGLSNFISKNRDLLPQLEPLKAEEATAQESAAVGEESTPEET